MENTIFGLVSFLIAVFAFGFGAVKLFKKGKPLYLQILVCAIGCFALEQLSYLVNLWCGITDEVSVGILGIFGCNFFLLSANFGTLDKVVDDGYGSKKARSISLIAPIIMIALVTLVFFSWKTKDMLCAVIWVLILIPAIPASYYNLKHILLPVDPCELLLITKPCNITALIFHAITVDYAICSSIESTESGILFIFMSLTVLSLSLCVVRGAKKWKI